VALVFKIKVQANVSEGKRKETMNLNDNMNRKSVSRVREYPELQVGFPERNEIPDPISEMERVHVDLETLNLSRKNAIELTREFAGNVTAEQRRIL
jgi:hypothetical protein